MTPMFKSIMFMVLALIILCTASVLNGCTQLQRLNQAQDQAEEIVYDTAEEMLCRKIDVDDAITRYGRSPVLFAQWAEFCRLHELLELVQSIEEKQ